MQIDTLTYSKRIHPLRYGYSTRGNQKPSAIVIHSTNGNRGSSFAGEAAFLRDSPNVSAHFLVGKAGQLAQILPPSYAAWHAGEAIPEYANPRSIGIETHHAVGDDYPAAQRDALTWLCRFLMKEYGISREKIETHRKVALPRGRKVDPSDWSDAHFYAWRAQLTPLEEARRTYRVRHNVVANIRTGPAQNKPVVGVLSGGDTWRGVQVRGQLVKLQSFGASDIWIVDEEGRAVWGLLLEAL
jgi:N-acetyl-anhydromuramyl-L-alanine amidase AmpD